MPEIRTCSTDDENMKMWHSTQGSSLMKYLTTSEAAELIGISPPRLRSLMADGVLPAKKSVTWRKGWKVLTEDAMEFKKNRDAAIAQRESARRQSDKLKAQRAGKRIKQEECKEKNLGLTIRQTDALRLLANGNTNKMIGYEMNISPKTADCHICNILKRLGAVNAAHAVAIAYQRGILG